MALAREFACGVRSAGGTVTELHVYRLRVLPCVACEACAGSGQCRLSDEMDRVYAAVREHAGLVVAAPIYFAGLPGPLKSVVDRFQSAWSAKYRLGKPWFLPEDGRRGFFLAVSAATRQAWYDCARAPLELLWRTLNYTDAGGLYCGGLEGPGAAAADPAVLARAFRAGEGFAAGT